MPTLNRFCFKPLPLNELMAKVAILAPIFSPRQMRMNVNPTLDALKVDYLGEGAGLAKHDGYVQLMAQAKELPGIEAIAITLREQGGQSPQATLTFSNHSSAVAYISVEQLNDSARYLALYRQIDELFTLVAEPQLQLAELSPAAQQAIAHQEQTLKTFFAEVSKLAQFNLDQRNQQSEFIRETAERSTEFLRQSTAELNAEFKKREEEFGASARAKEEELVAKNNARLADLEQREEAHRTRVAEFDLRGNTVVRRDNLKNFQKIIEGQRELNLSDATNKKRNVIHALCGCALGLSGLLVLGFAGSALVAKPPTYTNIIPLSTSILFFATTLIYYLRWNDQWFREHAHAEFLNRRLVSDILRANWLAEMLLEARDKNKEIPESVLANFSQGLFRDETVQLSAHPADQLTELVGKISNIKVGKDGVELARK